VALAVEQQRVDDGTASSQAMRRVSLTRPVSVSTSTTATWAPNGNVAPGASKRVSIVTPTAVVLGQHGEVGPGLGDGRRPGDVERP
jgi:hypothetical protein